MSTSNNDNESKEKSKVDLDKVLAEEIGQFGRFQIRIIAQCLFATLFISWNINEFVFTTARIETRCLIPECENRSDTDFSPSWITTAVPSSGGAVDNCQRYGNTSASLPTNDTCPASLFDTSTLEACEEYVYEHTHSVVYDFNLACDEWRRAMVGSVRIFGMMVALAITGYVSDRWGRRLALALNATCAAALGVVRYWAPSYNVYVIILFIESALGCGTFTCTYVMIIELFGPKYRVRGGATINTAFAMGQITLGLIAWAVTDWRNLILALYIPQFLCIFFFWTLTESVRWLLSKGKFNEAEALLQDAARINRKQLSQESLERLKINAEEENKKAAEKKNEKSLVLLVLNDRRILIRCIVTCMWWATSTFVYYGLSFNAVNLTGNMYLNYVVVCAVEIPGFWTVVLLIDRIGRKPTLITAFWLCTACQVAFIFINEDLSVLSLVIYMLGKFAISVVIITMNIFTLELYPTEYRHRLYNFSSMIGRFGSILAPLTPALAATVLNELPFILFGVTAFVAGVMTFLVPETLGIKLADTMEEALQVNNAKKKEVPT